MMRYLMRLKTEKGSAQEGGRSGYYVGGKTGPPKKVVTRVFPRQGFTTFAWRTAPDQRNIANHLMDEPQGTPGNPATRPLPGNAGVAAGAIIGRIAPSSASSRGSIAAVRGA